MSDNSHHKKDSEKRSSKTSVRKDHRDYHDYSIYKSSKSIDYLSSSRRSDSREGDLEKRERSEDDSYSSDYSSHKTKKKSSKSKSKKDKKKSKKKHKEKKEKYELGDSNYLDEIPKIGSEDTVFTKKEKSDKSSTQRESWMTFDGLNLDAFNVSGSSKKASYRADPEKSKSIVFESKSIDSSPNSNHGVIEYNSDYTEPKKPEVSLDYKNNLQARILKAKMLGSDNLAQLEKEYAEIDFEDNVAQNKDHVIVLPTYNIRGDFLDTGSGEKRSHHKKEKIKTHDEKGVRINFSGDYDDSDIATLLRQEKQSRTEDHSSSLARNILRDQRYSNDNDYLDEKSEQLAASTQRSEYQKRLIAVNDYKKTQKALDRCWFCFKNEGTPVVPVVSMGHQAYLALPTRTELVPGQCLIVPGEHLVTSLDGDDALWTEIRNFMKCLMQTFADQDKGVIFIETITDLSRCNHTVIECIPLPWSSADDAPAYFREGLLEVGEEWSNHKKIIDTKPRTFRRSMTSRLPYFHVWFHLDGGYGHIIEDSSRFPSTFSSEIIAGMLNLDPIKWRRPTNYSPSLGPARIESFKKATNWSNFDWTKMLD